MENEARKLVSDDFGGGAMPSSRGVGGKKGKKECGNVYTIKGCKNVGKAGRRRVQRDFVIPKNGLRNERRPL